jgi:outer membrane lipoprotein-sorting protein
MTNFIKTISTITLALTSAVVFANPSAYDIMKKADARDDGTTLSGTIKMVLIDKHGKKRIRVMKSYQKDIDENTEHKSIFFLSPSDVKNTAFLNYDYKNINSKEDDQWMYLPALKKTKRIPTSDKDSSFMGSDFTYSDMTAKELDDYNYKFIKSSSIKRKTGSVPVWIIESKPKNRKVMKETGYSRSIYYVRKDNHVVSRAKLYMVKGKRVKYMDIRELMEINGIWVATKSTMVTKKAKTTLHKTVMSISDIKVNEDIDDSLFTIRQMEKGL